MNRSLRRRALLALFATLQLVLLPVASSAWCSGLGAAECCCDHGDAAEEPDRHDAPGEVVVETAPPCCADDAPATGERDADPTPSPASGHPPAPGPQSGGHDCDCSIVPPAPVPTWTCVRSDDTGAPPALRLPDWAAGELDVPPLRWARTAVEPRGRPPERLLYQVFRN